jgi:hypothetical protein
MIIQYTILTERNKLFMAGPSQRQTLYVMNQTLFGPILIQGVDEDIIQVSVHRPGKGFLREIAEVFTEEIVGRGENLLVVSTMQRSSVELVAFGEEAESEKDKCLLKAS